jgi:hypothetical protein
MKAAEMAPRMWSSSTGFVAGGSATLHIIRYHTAPEAAAIRMAIPRARARPIPSRASMKRVSAHAAPAILFEKPLSGPSAPNLRKPSGGRGAAMM